MWYETRAAFDMSQLPKAAKLRVQGRRVAWFEMMVPHVTVMKIKAGCKGNNDCDDYQGEVEEPIIPYLTYTKGYCLLVTAMRAR